jgi:hypothetical protein
MRGRDYSGLAERSPFLEQSIDLAGEQWEASHALIPCLLTEWMVEAGLDRIRGMC